MGGEQVDLSQRLEVSSGCLHELHGAMDLRGQRFVARIRRVGREAAVPVVDQAQISVATFREGANQVERGGSMLVGAQQSTGVGCARLLGEFKRVHRIAAIRRQGHVTAFFDIR